MFRMMSKMFTLIATGLLLWYSVESRSLSIKELVNDCFQYKCISNDTNSINSTANKKKGEEKVCGINGVLYENMEALECASRCAGLYDHVITKGPLGFCTDHATALDFY